jgi:SAM-dependent methyltransferase
MDKARLEAFDEIAGRYRQFRPSYPPSLFEELARYVSPVELEGDGDLLALDVGAGTGIATRQLAHVLDRRWRILGVEPGSGMLEQAQTEDDPRIAYVHGQAEQLPVGDGEAALVMAAQAAQWFDRRAFYAETMRVLRPHGAIALIQNNRHWQESEFLSAYETLLERSSPGYSRNYRAFDYRQELEDQGFARICVHHAEWTRPMTGDAFLGMAHSSSKVAAAVKAVGLTLVDQAIEELLATFARDGIIEIPYVTELFLGEAPGTGEGIG